MVTRLTRVFLLSGGPARRRPPISRLDLVQPALILHLVGAACALALGVMLVVVASVLFGVLLTVGGGAWFAWALRRA